MSEIEKLVKFWGDIWEKSKNSKYALDGGGEEIAW